MINTITAFSERQPIRHVYLLCSLDIIGSTKTKYKNEPWFRDFLNIYETIVDSLNQLLSTKLKISYHHKFTIWKFVGDEVLLYIECKKELEIVDYVKAFKSFMHYWNSDAITTPKIKGTLWIAQPNTIDRCFRIKYPLDSLSIEVDNHYVETDESIIEEVKENASVMFLDFLGPSIDCGFRIAKNANENNIAISVEVADVLLRNNELTNYIFYNESTKEKLKGVFNNEEEYPLFTLNSSHEEDNNTNKKDIIDAYYTKIKTTKYSKMVRRINDDTFKVDSFRESFGKLYKYTPETNSYKLSEKGHKVLDELRRKYTSALEYYNVEKEAFSKDVFEISQILEEYKLVLDSTDLEALKNILINEFHSFKFVKFDRK